MADTISRTDSSVLEEQRALIRTLIEEKRASERRFESLSEASKPEDWVPSSMWPDDGLSAEIRTYLALVQKMVSDIDACCSRLDQTRHARIRHGVLNIHRDEIFEYIDNFSRGDPVAELLRGTYDNLRRHNPNGYAPSFPFPA